MLKSDLRGIETPYMTVDHQDSQQLLKSDLRGIETRLNGSWREDRKIVKIRP